MADSYKVKDKSLMAYSVQAGRYVVNETFATEAEALAAAEKGNEMVARLENALQNGRAAYLQEIILQAGGKLKWAEEELARLV